MTETDVLQTFESLVRLETHLWTDLDRELVDAGRPSLAWVSVLRVVAATPGCRVGDVGRVLGVTHGGLSKLADRIVAAGLLERTPDPSDRRAVVLVLTAQGRTTLRDAEGAATAWLARRLAGAERRETLQDHLSTLRHQLEEHR